MPLSHRLIAIMKRASNTNEVSPREFVTFLYLLEQIQISVVKTVGSHLCLNTVVGVFHFITDGKYRRVMNYFIHLVKNQLWYFETLCKYIDYRIYEHDESALLSVIPTYMPIWLANSSDMDSIIYCETMNILNVSTTSSITFFYCMCTQIEFNVVDASIVCFNRRRSALYNTKPNDSRKVFTYNI